jgi:acetyltransferase-like isoleucine patch superfamily enzyme
MFTMVLPGGQNLRVSLHRARGVHIGKNVWISTNVVLETEFPQLITIDDSVFIGIGVIVIAHFKELRSGVLIGKQAFIGPGVIILPNVQIGEGAVVTAGSVVTSSVPPMTVVQGNPAVPVAQCGVPLWPDTPLKEFSRRLRPISKK